MAESGATCWICFGCDATGMISPCDCAGTMGVVHEACLLRWIRLALLSDQTEEAVKCPNCRFAFCLQADSCMDQHASCGTAALRQRIRKQTTELENCSNFILAQKVVRHILQSSSFWDSKDGKMAQLHAMLIIALASLGFLVTAPMILGVLLDRWLYWLPLLDTPPKVAEDSLHLIQQGFQTAEWFVPSWEIVLAAHSATAFALICLLALILSYKVLGKYFPTSALYYLSSIGAVLPIRCCCVNLAVKIVVQLYAARTSLCFVETYRLSCLLFSADAVTFGFAFHRLRLHALNDTSLQLADLRIRIKSKSE